MTLRRAHLADAPSIAQIHRAAFDHPWSEADAEILTIAVDPAARRNGYARTLLAASKQELAGLGVMRLFLEVAADNLPAVALYEREGFLPVGVRKAYYRRESSPNMDAKLLSCALPAAH
jgi:ribosomal-protein-alanine N-acetyltransferase